MGGRAQRLPPKEHRKNIVLALIRFVSLLFLCALLLLFSLLFFLLLLLVLVSGVVCLVLCFKLLNITPHKFPKAGGGHGGEGAAPPPQRTQEEHRFGFDPFPFCSFPLCRVIVVLVVVLPSFSCCCVWCRRSCFLLSTLITPHKCRKAGGGHFAKDDYHKEKWTLVVIVCSVMVVWSLSHFHTQAPTLHEAYCTLHAAYSSSPESILKWTKHLSP